METAVSCHRTVLIVPEQLLARRFLLFGDIYPANADTQLDRRGLPADAEPLWCDSLKPRGGGKLFSQPRHVNFEPFLMPCKNLETHAEPPSFDDKPIQSRWGQTENFFFPHLQFNRIKSFNLDRSSAQGNLLCSGVLGRLLFEGTVSGISLKNLHGNKPDQ